MYCWFSILKCHEGLDPFVALLFIGRLSNIILDLRQVLFLKNTHYVVSAGKDCLIKIWDSDSRELITQLHGHIKAITCLTTTRLDGDRIIAGGERAFLITHM